MQSVFRALKPLLAISLMLPGLQAAKAETLDEVIAAALAHSPAISASDARQDAAEAQVRGAEANRLPSASVSGEIGTGWIDPRGFFGLAADNVTPRAAKVTIEQPLYAGGRITGGIARARAGQQAALFGAEAVRQQIIVVAVSAYMAVRTARLQQERYQQLVGEMDEILRQAKLRYQIGESPSTDVSQAQARLAEAQAGLARAQADVTIAEARYTRLSGQEPGAIDDNTPLPELPLSLDEAMSQAVTTNPVLAQSEAARSAAAGSSRMARAESRPEVGLFAEGASVRDQFFPGYKADSASVGLRARWTFFDSGRAGSKVSQAQAQERAADADYREARDAVQEAVIAGWSQLKAQQANIDASRLRRSATQNSLRSIRLEVSVGAKPQLALLDAEREDIAASTAAAEAEADLIVAAYQLRALIGQR